MNARIPRFLFGATIASATALLLLAEQVPTPVASSPAVAPVIPSAGEILVDTAADEFDVSPNGTCSLREAILSANDQTDFGGCIRNIVLFATTETIFLPSGTYTLTRTGSGEDFDVTGDLDIRRSMIISSTGALSPTVTANPGWDDRIFHILTGTVTIERMIISGGSEQGGTGGGAVRIESGQSLTLNDSEAIYNTSCSLSCGGGGGIYNNSGTLTLNNVTLTNNFSRLGGGIWNAGTATLTNVTLSGNGGLLGGGIWNAGTAALTNVTLSSNYASSGGGIFAFGGTAALTNVTLSGDSSSSGGGIFMFGGTATLTNTIVVISPIGVNCSAYLGGSFNLSSDNSCGFGAGRDNVNVMLAPLGDYGGPTPTHMLLPGSPAINFGTNTGCPATDQRGKPRPVNGICDVGAVERQTFDFPFMFLPLILK